MSKLEELEWPLKIKEHLKIIPSDVGDAITQFTEYLKDKDSKPTLGHRLCILKWYVQTTGVTAEFLTNASAHSKSEKSVIDSQISPHHNPHHGGYPGGDARSLRDYCPSTLFLKSLIGDEPDCMANLAAALSLLQEEVSSHAGKDSVVAGTLILLHSTILRAFSTRHDACESIAFLFECYEMSVIYNRLVKSLQRALPECQTTKAISRTVAAQMLRQLQFAHEDRAGLISCSKIILHNNSLPGTVKTILARSALTYLSANTKAFLTMLEGSKKKMWGGKRKCLDISYLLNVKKLIASYMACTTLRLPSIFSPSAQPETGLPEIGLYSRSYFLIETIKRAFSSNHEILSYLEYIGSLRREEIMKTNSLTASQSMILHQMSPKFPDHYELSYRCSLGRLTTQCSPSLLLFDWRRISEKDSSLRYRYISFILKNFRFQASYNAIVGYYTKCHKACSRRMASIPYMAGFYSFSNAPYALLAKACVAALRNTTLYGAELLRPSKSNITSTLQSLADDIPDWSQMLTLLLRFILMRGKEPRTFENAVTASGDFLAALEAARLAACNLLSGENHKLPKLPGHSLLSRILALRKAPVEPPESKSPDAAHDARLGLTVTAGSEPAEQDPRSAQQVQKHKNKQGLFHSQGATTSAMMGVGVATGAAFTASSILYATVFSAMVAVGGIAAITGIGVPIAIGLLVFAAILAPWLAITACVEKAGDGLTDAFSGFTL